MTARRFVLREPAAADLASDPPPGIGVQVLLFSRALGGAPQAADTGARG